MNVLLKYCFSKTLMVLSRIAVVSEKNIFQTTHVAKKKTKFRKKKNKIQNKKKTTCYSWYSVLSAAGFLRCNFIVFHVKAISEKITLPSANKFNNQKSYYDGYEVLQSCRHFYLARLSHSGSSVLGLIVESSVLLTILCTRWCRTCDCV